MNNAPFHARQSGFPLIHNLCERNDKFATAVGCSFSGSGSAQRFKLSFNVYAIVLDFKGTESPPPVIIRFPCIPQLLNRPVLA